MSKTEEVIKNFETRVSGKGEVSLLNERLQKLGVRVLGLTLGSNPNVTPEQVAEAINKVLDELERLKSN